MSQLGSCNAAARGLEWCCACIVLNDGASACNDILATFEQSHSWWEDSCLAHFPRSRRACTWQVALDGSSTLPPSSHFIGILPCRHEAGITVANWRSNLEGFLGFPAWASPNPCVCYRFHTNHFLNASRHAEGMCDSALKRLKTLSLFLIQSAKMPNMTQFRPKTCPFFLQCC